MYRSLLLFVTILQLIAAVDAQVSGEKWYALFYAVLTAVFFHCYDKQRDFEKREDERERAKKYSDHRRFTV